MQELQHKLRQAKHDIAFAQSVQSKLLGGESLEREVQQLREENAGLRAHVDNVGLLRYQLQSLREQVERGQENERKAVRLEEENKLLRQQLTDGRDEGPGTGGRYVVKCLVLGDSQFSRTGSTVIRVMGIEGAVLLDLQGCSVS